jgi:hypothetical protein
LLIAGATGVLGNAVMQRLVGIHRYAHTRLLAREPMAQGVRMVSLEQVSGDIVTWPAALQRSDVAVVMFEPPRMYYERERALWTPEPAQLPALCAWLKAAGVSTLAIVLPHVQGSLPESLRRGLASLDEQAVASMGFERLLILRSAQKPLALRRQHVLQRLAHWMLGIFAFMVPAQEQPVRPSKIALILDALLLTAPAGITVLAQEDMWTLGQCEPQDVLAAVQARFDNTGDIS